VTHVPLLHEEKILIAGSGGQGTLFLGKTIARAAARMSFFTSYIPSYGAEMRGGTAHCFVRVSEQEIASPIFKKFTTLFAFNSPSWEKFKKRAERGALVIVNSSLFDVQPAPSSLCIRKVPLSELCIELGSPRVINIIALGVFLKERGIFAVETVKDVLRETTKDKAKALELNLKALEVGLRYG